MIKYFDANGDGFIDFAEFQDALKKMKLEKNSISQMAEKEKKEKKMNFKRVTELQKNETNSVICPDIKSILY